MRVILTREARAHEISGWGAELEHMDRAARQVESTADELSEQLVAKTPKATACALFQLPGGCE